MLSKTLRKKTILTLVVIAVVISLGSIGANWKVGFAETNPTLPTVSSIIPDMICVNSGTTVVTIFGSDFIDVENTRIEWKGPTDLLPIDIFPNYVRVDGKELRFTVSADKLTTTGKVEIYIVNHPDLADPDEVGGPFYIDIAHCVMLPIIHK